MLEGPLSISMELRSLPETDNRIILWRNTIQLFHRYKKNKFNGPFFDAGYTTYRVESPLSEKNTGTELHPDIFACGPNGWLVIELSCNDKSKCHQLDNYRNLDSRSLALYGCEPYDNPPDTISSRLSMNNDGNHCEMIVKETFHLNKDEYIQNDNLREALIQMRGKSLRGLPEIPFSLVPEMKHYEIRRGLIDIVMQLFDGSSEGKTPYQMCEDALERLFPLVTTTAKKSLVEKIKSEMEPLVKKELNGYLIYQDGKYIATDKYKQSPQSRNRIASKLQEWANPSQRRLLDFHAATDVTED